MIAWLSPQNASMTARMIMAAEGEHGSAIYAIL